MSDRVSALESRPDAPERERPGLVADVVRALGVLVVFALAGAAGGWVWHRLWTPPLGVAARAAQGAPLTWFPLDETALNQMFGATGLYLLVGVVGGLVLGLVAGLVLRRSELVVLAAVLVGSVLAAWLTHLVGQHLGPPSPDAVAARSPEGTRIPGDMATPGHSFYVAWPLGSLLGLTVAYLLPSLRLRAPAGLNDERTG